MLRLALLIVAMAVAVVVENVGATPGPGPGEPFGGNDAGCVPVTREQEKCSSSAALAYAKLESSVTTCHFRQEKARYSEVILGRSSSFDDEACEAKAATRFDRAIEKLANGACLRTPIPATAPSARDALVTTLDGQNGDVYCDSTSGVLLDPGGDDAGFVPATSQHHTCTSRVTGMLGKLAKSVRQCHRTNGARSFQEADPAFDEEACEAKALVKFDAATARLAPASSCPPCLDAPSQHAVAVALISRLDATNAAIFPCPEPLLHLEAVRLDPPTLMTLGVQLLISGDENHNAAVAMRYRRSGDPLWKDALPLYRVRPEVAPVGHPVPEQFAGSIFDLRPATTYEIELQPSDPDGPVAPPLPLTATTRAVPADPVSPHFVAVTTTGELSAALAGAQAGDVITLADGTYAGPFVLGASGTASAPIVIRGASRDGTILDGGGCGGCNVLDVYGSFIHVENLTLRNANRALRFQTAGAEANVVRRLRVENTRYGFGAREDQRDFYVCDNVLEGRLVWPHVYSDDGGAHASDDGILVQGNGHVVCHNQISGYGDALKTEQMGSRGLDFYGNEVLAAYDNGIELDLSEGNVRCMRNRFTNTYATLSFQPIYGGPVYAVRNVVINAAYEQMKLHGLGSSTGPSGVLAYHNTFVSPARALFLNTNVASHYSEIMNNLFIGPELLTGTRVVDWLAPIDAVRLDYDGYFPDAPFRFNQPPSGLVTYANFAALQAGGVLETNGTLLTAPIFDSGLVSPASYTTTMSPVDVTPTASSGAIDSAVALPNLADGYQGAAPDRGAVERGCPPPIYGVRPIGVDESNEPLGCP